MVSAPSALPARGTAAAPSSASLHWGCWLALATLIVLSTWVMREGTTGWDVWALGWFVARDRTGPAHWFWHGLVATGQPWVVTTAVVGFSAYACSTRRSWRPVVVCLLTLGGLDAVLWLLKTISGRTAPHSGLNDALAGGASFPSGHTANATAGAVIFTVLCQLPPGTRRWAARIASLVTAVAVGVSTLVLAYHWPSDVMGGWLLGAFAAGVATTRLHPGQAAGGAGDAAGDQAEQIPV